MEQNLGIKVRVTYHPDSRHYKSGTKYEEFRNTTEIHYNYRVSQGGYSVEDWMKLPEASMHKEIMIAFESDVHCTGYTMEFSEILEFDTWPESEKAEHM
jgi:hypothetical protein